MYCTAVHSCVSERGGWRTFTVSPFLRFTTTLAESEGSRKIAARSTAISAVAAAGTATAGEGRRMKKTPAAITARADDDPADQRQIALFPGSRGRLGLWRRSFRRGFDLGRGFGGRRRGRSRRSGRSRGRRG